MVPAVTNTNYLTSIQYQYTSISLKISTKSETGDLAVYSLFELVQLPEEYSGDHVGAEKAEED